MVILIVYIICTLIRIFQRCTCDIISDTWIRVKCEFVRDFNAFTFFGAYYNLGMDNEQKIVFFFKKNNTPRA